MRITFAIAWDKMLTNINRDNVDMNRFSSRLASGKQLLDPSDDPVAWSQMIEMKQGLREIVSFQNNVDFAVGWNEATEDALNRASDLILRAKEIGMSAVKAVSAEEQSAKVSQLEQIFEEALGVVNEQYGELYLFSGTLTSTPPFQVGESTDPDYPDYNYYGNTEAYRVRVGNDFKQTINLNGEEAFFTDPSDVDTSLLKRIMDLKDAVQAGDADKITALVGGLDADYEHMSKMQAVAGARLESLDRQEATLSSLSLSRTGRLSEIQEADMVEVIVRLKQKEVAYQAALQSTALIGQLNLAKYL